MAPARSLPATAYLPNRTGQDNFIRDMDILRSGWAVLCHEGAAPDPGDNLAIELHGVPILLRRSHDGGLAGYLNTCPHRGGPLAWPGRNNTRLLQCRYHGWSFRSNGALIEPIGFGPERAAIRCTGLSLQKLRIENCGGLILGTLATAEDASPPPGLPEELATRLASAALISTEAFPAACNWKLYAENWLEPYHLQSLHRDLSADVQANTYRVSAGPAWCEHSARPEKGTYGGYWAFLYPATAINFFLDGFSIEQVSPTSATTCLVRYQFYKFLDKNREDGIEKEIALTRIVTGEDIAAAEHVQKCLESGIFEQGYISQAREAGILAFYDFLRARSADT